MRSAGRNLVRWYAEHRRPLPWRAHRDPYHVWVSEVVLQQTRVDRAIRLYERFISRFPDLETLARASEEEVLKVWEGAGYYARARHLRRAAVEIAARGPPRWPTTVEAWERLPGVGSYIARAVASLAYGESVVALEANGRRVAARWSLETGDIRMPTVERRLERHLARAMPQDRPGDFNEGIMELGETVCLAQRPRCPACPISSSCRALHELPEPAALPRRGRRRTPPHVVAAIAVVERGDRFLVRRRPAHGLLGGLWELPGGKVEARETPVDTVRREVREETGVVLGRVSRVGVVRHSYSHFTVELHLFAGRGRGTARAPPCGAKLRWVTPSEFEALPRPLATIKAAGLWRRQVRDRASPDSGSHPDRRTT